MTSATQSRRSQIQNDELALPQAQPRRGVPVRKPSPPSATSSKTVTQPYDTLAKRVAIITNSTLVVGVFALFGYTLAQGGGYPTGVAWGVCGALTCVGITLRKEWRKIT